MLQPTFFHCNFLSPNKQKKNPTKSPFFFTFFFKGPNSTQALANNRHTETLLEIYNFASLWLNQSNWDFSWRLDDIYTTKK